jgi:hypothetical protein
MQKPIVRHLYLLREHGKKISFLNTAVDGDGRLRTSFSIAGTTTGRLASSFSEFGTGTNLQNVENRLRAIFIADPGYKFGNIDLEQSDARAVGAIHWNLFRDSRYLDFVSLATFILALAELLSHNSNGHPILLQIVLLLTGIFIVSLAIVTLLNALVTARITKANQKQCPEKPTFQSATSSDSSETTSQTSLSSLGGSGWINKSSPPAS